MSPDYQAVPLTTGPLQLLCLTWAGETKYYSWIRLLLDLSLCHFYKPECYSQKANNAGRKPPVYIDEKIQHILGSTMPLIREFFYQNKKPIWKILRTDKNNNFKFSIMFLMTLHRPYIGYLGFLGFDLFKSVLMYSNGTICLIKLLFKMGLFTVYSASKVLTWCIREEILQS